MLVVAIFSASALFLGQKSHSSVCFLQKRKEKGRVELERVHTIEEAQSVFSNEEVGIQGEFFPFLVGYHQEEDYTLFLLGSEELDRIGWIFSLRKGKPG